jgi:hypothetical protein
MTKSQTSWTNSTETPVSWVVVGRGSTAWVNGDVKNSTQYTTVSKGSTAWSNEGQILTPYLYDDAAITYNNSYVYDYLMMTTNTTNNKVPTAWSAA